MGQINTREIVLLASASQSTSATGPDTNMIQAWQAAVITCNVSSASGTSPTLDVYVQMKLGQAATTDVNPGPPTGTGIYDDLLHFTQITTTAVRISHLATGPLGISTVSTQPTITTGADWAQSDAALAAGTLRMGPLGGLWRCKFVLGGTSPVFNFSVVAQLIPFST